MAKENKDMRVMLLSADKSNDALVTKALHNLDFKNILHMDNGLEALAKVQAEPFDFVICDMNIRFINGWLFIKEIKISDRVPNIPVILFGAVAAPDTEDGLKKYGIIRYMKLPFTASDMNFTIHSTVTLFTTSGTIENKFSKAKTSLMSNEVAKATELYDELRGLTANSARSSMGLAQTYMRGDDAAKAKAEKIIEEIAEGGEAMPSRFLMSAKLHLQNKKVPEAGHDIKILLEQLPNEFYYSRSVRLYLDFNHYQEAEIICVEALEKKYEVPDFYVCLAKCKYATSLFDDSLNFIKSAETKFGMTPDLYNLKGVCLKKTGLVQEAMQCYEEALRLSPHDARVYYNLAQCSIGMKNYPAAMRYLEACLKIAPNFPKAKEKLAEIQQHGSCAPIAG